MTISINFNTIHALNHGQIDIVKNWFETNKHKKNYDATYCAIIGELKSTSFIILLPI
jgi:hypothetical protein